MVGRTLIALIKGYQVLISPLFGPTCRFVPSCSTYTIDALRELGVAKGLWRAMRRLLKCHPFHPGGYDPI